MGNLAAVRTAPIFPGATLSETVDPDLPTFPLARTCPFQPHAEYSRLREEAPVSRVNLPNSGDTAWAVTRHADVRAVLRDTRFSSDNWNPRYPLLTKGDRPPHSELKAVVNLDPPEHTEARRTMIDEFTVRRMKAIRPRVQELIDGLVDQLLDGPREIDLRRAYCLPIPSLVMCELLGVPEADRAFFETHSTKMVTDPNTPEFFAALQALVGYLNELVAAKLKEPTDDLLGRRITALPPDDPAAHGQLVLMAMTLLAAGHETTSSSIALGVIGLLEHPGELAKIREDPAKIAGATEELLRYFTVTDLVTTRVATEDVEVGGELIRTGDAVLALGYAANRDPAEFPDPDTFDIGRGSRRHLAFGYGPHQCIGQNLARMEMEVALETLFRRIPGIRITVPVAELSYKDETSPLVYGVHELPVTW